jgi:hypothetical protein
MIVVLTAILLVLCVVIYFQVNNYKKEAPNDSVETTLMRRKINIISWGILMRKAKTMALIHTARPHNRTLVKHNSYEIIRPKFSLPQQWRSWSGNNVSFSDIEMD